MALILTEGSAELLYSAPHGCAADHRGADLAGSVGGSFISRLITSVSPSAVPFPSSSTPARLLGLRGVCLLHLDRADQRLHRLAVLAVRERSVLRPGTSLFPFIGVSPVARRLGRRPPWRARAAPEPRRTLMVLGAGV
jgi:hypothetical protein